MKLVIPPVEIVDDEPFRNDVLKRKEFGDALFNLISRVDEPLVISIDAPWGEGKTTFVRMWQGLLKNSNIKSIYFDAFANDFVDDPFIAVASEIAKLAEAEFGANKTKKNKLDRFKKSAAKVGGQLLTWTAKVGVKAVTLGIIKDSDIEEIKEIKDDLAKGASDIVSKLIEERLSTYNEELESINSFRITLTGLASEIGEIPGKPLIIIIDELDRCKPTYAIELVERVKHLFSVKNVVFVLVMHKKQLEESIRCVYGQNIDANTYLQKFINLECTLPKNDGTSHHDDYKTYCNRLFALHELETWGDEYDLIESVAALAKKLNLSLRQLEKVLTYLTIFYSSITENTYRNTPVISFLVIAKVSKPELYTNLKQQKATLQDVLSFIDFPQNDDVSGESRNLYYMGLWIKFCLMSKADYDALDEKNDVKRCDNDQRLWKYNLTRDKIVPTFCRLIDLVKLN